MVIIDENAQECFCDSCQLKYIPDPTSWTHFAAEAAAFVMEHVMAHKPKVSNA